jgi:hypothetical protein
MARPTPTNPDLATALATANLAAANDATPWVEMCGPFLMLATGGVGQVTLEMSVDGGNTAIICQLSNGANNVWDVPVNQIVMNPSYERGLLYRLRCSTYTSGTIAARLSR